MISILQSECLHIDCLGLLCSWFSNFVGACPSVCVCAWIYDHDFWVCRLWNWSLSCLIYSRIGNLFDFHAESQLPSLTSKQETFQWEEMPRKKSFRTGSHRPMQKPRTLGQVLFCAWTWQHTQSKNSVSGSTVSDSNYMSFQHGHNLT